jgi:hypothetical protein
LFLRGKYLISKEFIHITFLLERMKIRGEGGGRDK